MERATLAEYSVICSARRPSVNSPVNPSVTARVQRAVETAKAYLAAHLGETVLLGTLAELTGVSRFHLCRAFKQVVGVSPRAFQTSLWIQQAKGLLRQGTPLAHVAIDLGFADQAHFTRTFKCSVGVTPGKYRGLDL